MAKQWDENAATAKQIAKNIITGEEVNNKGERLIHVVYRLDTFASDALNRKYAQYGSQANIHTYDGGRQTIDTQHADGTTGHFDSNGNNNPTNNAMDIEIEDYINNHLDESKNYKNIKKNIQRINESQLRAIVAESVKKVLNEISYKMVADAAAAAKDRESHFPKSISDYDLTPRHYKEDGRLDVDRYERDVERTHRTRQFPQTFKKEAYRRLYQELFGVDDLGEVDPHKIIEKWQELQDGIHYIDNNNTKYNWN